MKIISFIMAILMLFPSLYIRLFPDAPPAPSAEELMSMDGIIKKVEIGDRIYAVEPGRMTSDEYYAAICLQGIVAKTNPCIIFISSGIVGDCLSEYEKEGKKIIRTDAGGEKWNFASLLREFSAYVDGYVLYRNTEFAEGLNAATNYATAYNYLAVTPEVEQKVKDCGIELKKDISGEEYDYKFLWKNYTELKDYFRKDAVVHIKKEKLGLRDLAIQQGFYCFYTGGDTKGNRYLKKIIKETDENAAFLGWCEYEKNFVTIVSKGGCFVTPADYCFNNSIISLSKMEITSGNNGKGTAKTDPAKHYVCFLFSDGDNVQWIENGYGEYFSTVSSYPEMKISWTFSPVIREYCPVMFNKVTAASNKNTSFVCGPSGVGYANPSKYKLSALDGYTRMTAAAMLKSGQRIVTVLDDYNFRSEKRMEYSLGFFSRFDNIDGGLLFLDPDRYEAGKGKIWFSGGKPFVSTRLSLWHNDGYDGATDEWIKEQADIINGYPADITSINGYSLVCVHAWTMKPESLKKLYSQLDDGVEVLSAEDFIATITANVPHKTAKP